MKRPFLLAALAVLLLSNAFALLHAWMNRRGTADAELSLTARELSRNYSRVDDSRVSLTLRWDNTAAEYPEFVGGLPAEQATWFDQRKLNEMGFDVSVPPTATDAERYYKNSRSREVFVALEYDGAAWQQLLQDREASLRSQQKANPQLFPQAQIDEQLETQRRTASRLVTIDVGLDPAALRRKYPDRTHVMILRGLARPVLDSDRRPGYLRGAITQISNEDVNVPVPFGQLVVSIPYNYANPADSYIVTMRVGSNYEPWITDLKRIAP